jgi:N-acetylneuraminic acid mutarotase
MVAIGDNQLYLHGGMARSSFFDDFHCLDLTKNSWSHIKNKKMYPTARAGHSGTAAGTMLFIYGGMNRDGALDDLYRYDTSKTKVVVSLCFLKEVGISHLTFKGHAMLVFPLG